MTKPNILIILADGMQAGTVDPGHPCITPNLDALADRGVRFRNAHTTCPTCSPARASLMTGLLPHNHGVLEVEHGRDKDQCVLRTEHPHFAQRLSAAGYRTGYFGKWHVERTQDVTQFGWQEGVVKGAEHVKSIGRGEQGPRTFELDESLTGYVEGPRGYKRILHWGVTDTPLDERYPGLTAADADHFLADCLGKSDPWCCCVSFSEPNEALVVGRETWDRYDPDAVSLPENFLDDLSDRPNLYQREQQIGRGISEDHWRAARACYFGRITELDGIVQRLTASVDAAGQLENTIVVFMADHGRYVGAHGFDAHNFGAFEEIYRIPLIVAGPGVAAGATCEAQVSISDMGATFCELGQADPIDVPDSQSFGSLLAQPETIPPDFETGYAEYHGTRFPLMQRILWQGPWKFVFNGFDFDELYNLQHDPHEMHNRVNDPELQPRVESMMTEIWRRVRETGDRAIHESHYFSMRLACIGPESVPAS
ncbi:MAG: sulfatase-like hydrolase/transferase [Fuerstiella sp.]|nr:sulfatase-like hydrolase/transferase [Fuerstiella sp.]MCP4859221.1 sulfatase-like hydrolase/transferase [Fuerstiella sp.]